MRGWLSTIARARNASEEITAYQRLHNLLAFYSAIPVLSYDIRAAEQFVKLRRFRLRIGSMDLKIASIALSTDALLLSRNLKDFGRVPNLKVEDWTV